MNETVDVRGLLSGGPYSVTPGMAASCVAQERRQRLLVRLAGQHAGHDRPAPAPQAGRQAVPDQADVPLADVGDEVDGRDRARQALEVRRPRLPHVGRLRVLGGQAQRLDLSRGLAARVHEPDVRAEELVGGAEQEVAAHGLDVDRAVQRVVHGVDDAPGAGVAGERGGPRHVVDGADGVRRVAEGDDLRLPRPDELLERRPVERAGREVHRGLADHEPALLELQPGTAVGFVVERADHHFVAGLQAAARAPRRGGTRAWSCWRRS